MNLKKTSTGKGSLIDTIVFCQLEMRMPLMYHHYHLLLK